MHLLSYWEYSPQRRSFLLEDLSCHQICATKKGTLTFNIWAVRSTLAFWHSSHVSEQGYWWNFNWNHYHPLYCKSILITRKLLKESIIVPQHKAPSISLACLALNKKLKFRFLLYRVEVCTKRFFFKEPIYLTQKSGSISTMARARPNSFPLVSY